MPGSTLRSVELAPDELALIGAVVRAEERGEDPHTAALAAVPLLEADPNRFNVTLRRLAEDGYLDVAILRGAGRLLGAHVRRALPKGVDAARSMDAEAEILTVTELRLVERIVGELSAILECDELELSTDERAELEAQVATVGAQARSPRPRRRIIVEALSTARHVLEGAVGSGLAAGVIHLINQIQ